MGSVGVIEVPVGWMESPRYRHFSQTSDPVYCPVDDADYRELRYGSCVASSAVALMRSLELANFLRFDGSLPRSTFHIDRNNVFPVVWTRDGRCIIMSPLSRFTKDELGRKCPLLHIEERHNFHVCDRLSAIRFMCPSWEVYLHMGVVPQYAERVSSRVSLADDSEQFTSLRDAVRGLLKEPIVSAAIRSSALQRPISWIIDSGSGHDLVDMSHVAQDKRSG